jgi:hypothetical protein
MRNHVSSFGDFRCAHCSYLVSATHMLSGVNNRNHCPYCLWSCHLDLFAAGDRLSACKAGMKPIGLTMKKSRNKYRLEARGELMLIHECVDCGSLSINRIAADDDSESILMVFQDSFRQSDQKFLLCEQQGIHMLGAEAMQTVQAQLYGPLLETLIPMWE